MVDATLYSNKEFLQLIKANWQFQKAIAESETWQEVVKVIDSLDISYRAEQLDYVWQQLWQ